jgi:hypothetical protein
MGYPIKKALATAVSDGYFDGFVRYQISGLLISRAFGSSRYESRSLQKWSRYVGLPVERTFSAVFVKFASLAIDHNSHTKHAGHDLVRI